MGDHWAVIDGQEIEPMQRPFHAIYREDIQKWLEDGIVNEVHALERAEVQEDEGEALAGDEELATPESVVTNQGTPNSRSEVKTTPSPENSAVIVEPQDTVGSTEHTYIFWCVGAALLVVLSFIGLIRRRKGRR